MKVTIYWVTKDPEAVRKIRQRFGIPSYTSVNGETIADICEEDMPLLLECQKRKFIRIRNKHGKS